MDFRTPCGVRVFYQNKDYEHIHRAARTRPPGAVCHENEIFRILQVLIVENDRLNRGKQSFVRVNEKPTSLVFANYYLVLQPAYKPASDRCDKDFSYTILLSVELWC